MLALSTLLTTMIESCDDSLENNDVIYSDPNELELVEDVSVVIEDDAEKAQRLYHLLTGSASGVELYLMCTTELPTNSGDNIGRNIVMNRLMRYRSTQGKLKSGKIFWRNATSETILEVEQVFATIETGSFEWKNMLKIILAGVELPKALLHNKRSLLATKGPIVCDVAPPSFSDKPMSDADRVALLACALVDKSLSEF